MTRKKFIKSAMAMGYTRNWLDEFCRLSLAGIASIRKENPHAVFTWYYQLYSLEELYFYYGYPLMPSFNGCKMEINKTSIQADGKLYWSE